MLADKDLQEATDTIIKRYKNRLRRISQRNEEDVFSIAMNNLTSIFDPHSSYFSPKSAEDFEMTMSLKLEGIGALLTTEDDYPVIVSVVPGGPAEKTGKINPDDKIVKIAQMINPNEPAVDVVGWRIDEVVQLIRGKAGTKVELELIPAKTEDLSERKFVTITREEVKLEEQAAKSRIVEIEHNLKKSKIGIIDLPAFYIDFNAWRSRDPNFRSSSKDVEKILDEFNSLDVDGVIVDLRGNSGGSLFEANKLIGLFVASGATLQVKQNTGDIRTWGDAKAMQVWSKPMAVMVDRYSASASEIFAGAIQDYQRGLIIGHRTFGKGTVQKLDSLTSGQLKVTESKFYRITGSGMQNKGIIPDIALPATWDIEEFGESSLDAALPWDQVRPLRFKKFYMDPSILSKLKNTHSDRLMNNPDLQYILDIRERYDLQKDKETISLNINKRTLQKKDRQQWALKTENKRRAKLNLQIFETYDAMEEFNESKEDLEIDIDIENDYLLKEGANILSDYLHLYENILISKAA
jgi:carboxyl-terminal processing protease